MASRKGSLLEKNVEKILELSGFKPELNKIYKGYEIDVFLRYNNLKIGFECKQYERSTLGVRNLIHQWDSKNKELVLDRIVLVLVGCEITNADYQLAKKYGITLWGEQKLNSLLDKAIEKKIENMGNILREIGIKIDDKKTQETETEQQTIIKKALDKMLTEGLENSAYIIFQRKDSDYFIQFLLGKNGFIIDFPKTTIFNQKRINSIKEFLVSNNFIEPEKIKTVYDLNEFELCEFLNNIDGQCGEDTEFIAHLTDRIFRNVLNARDDYEIDVKISLDGSTEAILKIEEPRDKRQSKLETEGILEIEKSGTIKQSKLEIHIKSELVRLHNLSKDNSITLQINGRDILILGFGKNGLIMIFNKFQYQSFTKENINDIFKRMRKGNIEEVIKGHEILNPTEIDGIKAVLINNNFDEVSAKDISNLKQFEFSEHHNAMYAQCGEDKDFAASLIDEILKKALGTDDNCNLSSNFEQFEQNKLVKNENEVAEKGQEKINFISSF